MNKEPILQEHELNDRVAIRIIEYFDNRLLELDKDNREVHTEMETSLTRGAIQEILLFNSHLTTKKKAVAKDRFNAMGNNNNRGISDDG